MFRNPSETSRAFRRSYVGDTTAHSERMCLPPRRAMTAPLPENCLSITAIPSAIVRRWQMELLAEGVSAILASPMFYQSL